MNKIESPTTFLCPYAKKINQKKYNRLWDLGGDKKRTEKNENSKLRQATEPIDNHGGNMYALVSCNGIRFFLYLSRKNTLLQHYIGQYRLCNVLFIG